MPSVGPQLPPHLSKRKRTPDDESPPGSPAAKVRATGPTPANQDEIDLSGDDDDDGYVPPGPQPENRVPIGPTLPPSNTDEVNLDDSDDDDIGPSAPAPVPATRPSIGPTLPSTNGEINDVGPAPASTKRIQGPALPPAPLAERPPAPASEDSDSGSDSDDYGPALPSSTSHQARETQARAAEAAARAAEAAAGPQRDDWMLAPPTSGGYRAPDPTKLKSRRFASGPRASASSSSNGGEISSIWTETPEQKRKRLENAVLGRGDDDSSQTQRKTTTGSGAGPQREEAPEQQERIRSFTEATRGRSLYEEHQQSRKGRQLHADEEDDDPSKRAFDKEKDMKLGGRIGTAQKRELLNRAADFGGRFAKGKYL
ncbi:hypothetical protein F4677DRAFT_411923 [Hypoxylon crocopeplum]|nr:hypothetical protein F4677DRAFT_411923 [Hypoxylon crocopeplum]